jgi:hypothetical protein
MFRLQLNHLQGVKVITLFIILNIFYTLYLYLKLKKWTQCHSLKYYTTDFYVLQPVNVTVT